MILFKIKNLIKKSLKKIFLFFNLKIIKINKENENFPIEANDKIKDFINLSRKFSMTGRERMYLLSQAILNVKNNNLDGDFVECGVWRGGNILLFKLLNDFYNLNKNIFAYDTFEGMTTPQKMDITSSGVTAEILMKNIKKKDEKHNIHCFSEIEQVKKNILKYSNLNDIHFIKGPVEKTLFFEKNLPNKISILRLDTDFYSSTKIELERLFPRVVSGGVLIIDDYGFWKGARKAVDEYFNGKKWLHIVDSTCRYLIKD